MTKFLSTRRDLVRQFAAGAAFATLPVIALAADAVAPPLSAADQAEVARVEAYLNAMRTLSARFLQIAENGATAQGQFYLSRPGKLRLEYDPPVPILMISEGRDFLIHYDKSLKTIAYVPINSTPAGVLVRESIALSGDLTVTAVERGPGALRISVVQTKDPRAGRITLVFSDRPLQLSSWAVVDGQGQTTRVSLTEARADLQLDPTLFRFVAPPQNRLE